MAISAKVRVEAQNQFNFTPVVLYSIMSDWTAADTIVSDRAIQQMRTSLNEIGIEMLSLPIVGRDVVGVIKQLDPREHVVFNWCEGIDDDPHAYDIVPRLLDEFGIAYTGADAWALATSQNKATTKPILLKSKIPTPVSKVYTRAILNGWRRFPALVKPANEHCSCGITREAVVDTPQQLKERVQYVLDTWKCEALVEDFIDGIEYNVSVWGNGRLSVLPVAAIDYSVFPDYHDRLCTFDAKWAEASDAYRLTGVKCPAEIEVVLQRRIERVAVQAYRALRLRDYGRIDLRVREGVPYVLDINANPDITIGAGFARSARIAGYSYGEAIAKILRLAAKRRMG